MNRRPRTVGIIGLGYGRAHLEGFRAAGCEVVAVCQRNESAVKAAARQYGVAGAYTRWEDLLAQAKPDIVAIATPPALHLPILTRAMESGAHVLCEKPLAMNRAEALEMLAVAKRTGRAAITGFNWRYPVATQRFREQVDAGRLGRVFHVNARWLNGAWAAESAAATWRMDRAIAGHGALGDQGVHLIDMIRWLFGDFVRVQCQSGIAYPSRRAPGGGAPDAEDHATILGELAGGAQVSLTVSRVAHGAAEHSLEAYGTNGALAFRVARSGTDWQVGELLAAEPGGALAPVPLASDGAADADRNAIIGRATIAPMVRAFLDAIERGEAPAPSLADGMKAQAVLDAALASAQSGRRVEVAG